MAPTLNPYYDSSSSILEDDYVLVRRLGDSPDWKKLQKQIVLVRDPGNSKRAHLLRLTGIEGEWTPTVSGFVFIQSGHCRLEPDLKEECEEELGTVSLGLVEGVVTRVLWPLGRRQVLG